jgi:F0F1-type ATP synthase epsilon subunit
MISCTITSKTKTTHYEDIQAITLPGISGEFQILPGYSEAFALLGEGELTLASLQGEHYALAIANGGVYVKDDFAVIFISPAKPAQQDRHARSRKAD